MGSERRCGVSFSVRIGNGSPNLGIDLEGLLVGVEAVKPNDHRLDKKGEGDAEPAQSSIRSGKMFSSNAATQDNDEDWD